MTTKSTWFSRHASNTLVTSVLCMYMMLGGLGCSRHWLRDLFRHSIHHDKNPKTKAIPIVDTIVAETTPNSVSGTVGIQYDPVYEQEGHYVSAEDNNRKKEKYYAVPNIVVRAFQWHPKDNTPEPTDADDFAIANRDNVIYNTKFGTWQLADETVTDSKGHYVFKGTIIPGYETFIEVLGISRPANGLPTTYIIANKDVEEYDKGYRPPNGHYGQESDGEYCPKETKCRQCAFDKNSYCYKTPSKLTKDDRILYAFRKKVDLDDHSYRKFLDAIPRAPRESHEYGKHNGKDNPIIDFIMNDNNPGMTIVPEQWYKLSTAYTPIHEDQGLKVGTAILDIVKFMSDTILPGCDKKNSTILDLHYYPNIETFCIDSTKEYRKNDENKKSAMPEEIEQYATDHNHYYVALPPTMHLKHCIGRCYPQRLKELLLNSGLFREITKKDSRDLEKESRKANDKHKNLMDYNCY